MKTSLIGRLSSLITRYTVISISFVCLLVFLSGFAVYNNDMKSLERSVQKVALLMTDFAPFVNKSPVEVVDEYSVSSYATIKGEELFVNLSRNGKYEIYKISSRDLPPGVFIISPDGTVFGTGEKVIPKKGAKTQIDSFVGYAYPFSVKESFWWVFVGKKRFDFIAAILPYFLVICAASFVYIRLLKFYLLKTKDSLAKDLDGLKRLIEEFAVSGEVVALSGTESWEIRSLAKILFDVSQKMKESQSQILQKAGTDDLTGLANRRSFEERLERRILENTMFSLIFLDLDGFKNVNDTLGHDAGDEVLKATAEALKKVFRSYDFICRWGGDEFAVLFEGDAEKNFAKVRERIDAALSEIKLEKGLKVGVSAGYAVWPVDGKTSKALMQTADERMYADKIIRKATR